MIVSNLIGEEKPGFMCPQNGFKAYDLSNFFETTVEFDITGNR